MAKKTLTSKTKSARDPRAVIGEDSTGKPVHVGDTVNHVKKRALVGGWVTNDVMLYRNEKATIVRFPSDNHHLNRFSQMTVTVVNNTPKMVKAALQAVEAERAALMKRKQVEKEKASLKDCPRDNKSRQAPKKVWSHYPETSGGLPSLGKRR